LAKKGVLKKNSMSQSIFALLRYPYQITDPEARSYYESARERLIRLMASEEEIHSCTIPKDLHNWSESEFPGYNKANVFFLNRPTALSQRYQLSGLCYMNGPAMVQHYALTHNNRDVPMIDLLKFIKEHFSARQLEKHIFDDEGGVSSVFLQSILQPNSTLITTGLPQLPNLFDTHGPGLVSKFQVHEDFYDSSIRKHYGKPSGDMKGWHAMTLVGHRIDEKGTPYYLLQNWWKNKQFVEVDADYLEHCGANFHFIKTPQTAIPSNFAANYGRYYELEAIDKPEGHANEMSFE